MGKDYDQRAVDIDALEKVRLQEEAETERTLIQERENTKRARELTKRDPQVVEGRTIQRIVFIIAFGLVILVGILCHTCVTYHAQGGG